MIGERKESKIFMVNCQSNWWFDCSYSTNLEWYNGSEFSNTMIRHLFLDWILFTDLTFPRIISYFLMQFVNWSIWVFVNIIHFKLISQFIVVKNYLKNKTKKQIKFTRNPIFHSHKMMMFNSFEVADCKFGFIFSRSNQDSTIFQLIDKNIYE